MPDKSRQWMVALCKTVLSCCALEALALVFFQYWTKSWAGAVVLSIIVLGPLSLWFARPLYRYWRRAKP